MLLMLQFHAASELLILQQVPTPEPGSELIQQCETRMSFIGRNQMMNKLLLHLLYIRYGTPACAVHLLLTSLQHRSVLPGYSNVILDWLMGSYVFYSIGWNEALLEL